MAYVTPAQLAERPGPEELAQVATPRRYPAVAPALLDTLLRGGDLSAWSAGDVAIAEETVAVIAEASVQADGLIDGFLARRGHRLPLNPVPALVTGWARAIVRYALHKDRLSSEGTDPILRDYKDAIKLLTMVAEGKLSLGGDDPTTPRTAGSPGWQAPKRLFTFESLEDFGK